jgi:SAM-dependent methyltransferase
LFPRVPARDDATEFPAHDRGAEFLALLREVGIVVDRRVVVDLGTGFGSIAIAAAKSGARRVVAIDVELSRLNAVRERSQQSGAEVRLIQMNLLQPAVGRAFADVAFLIGVVEYAGLWNLKLPVSLLQRQLFEVAHASLKPGGTLVFASKNRLWPRFAVEDVHTKLPLVNVLPRGMANWLSNAVSGRPYRHHIHSPRRWKGLLREAGFKDAVYYHPFFSYQFPVAISSRPSLADIPVVRERVQEISPRLRSAALGKFWRQKAYLMALSGALRFPLSQSLIFVARR